LAPHHVENPREIVAPGDDVKVKILEIDSERRRLSLSVKRVEGQVLEPKVLPPEESSGEQPEGGAGDLDDLPELGLSEEVFAEPAGAAPAESAELETPVESAEAVTAVEPAEPATPAEPEMPAESAEPVTAAEPAAPAELETAAESAEPETTAEPAAPEAAAEPAAEPDAAAPADEPAAS
ncbi:MAG: small subunit ribosomal protein, partial [Solirubrobacteraceae bacterium]|nr:small subunit ribosomal protein [Solirubrobacteraceae bacterium]